MTSILPHPYKLSSAIILCGGQGTRFRSVSETIPKILAPVGAQRLVDILVYNLTRQGIEHVVFATGHLNDVVEAYLNQQKKLNIIISKEDQPLGTGGALRKASRFISDENLFVLNGDTFIDLDIKKMLAFHCQENADFTMCLTSQNLDGDYGRVRLNADNTVAELKSKTLNTNQYTNAGVYIIKSKLLSKAPIQCSSLEDQDLPIWINSKRVLGHVIHKPLFDIGTPERYQTFLNAFDRG